MLKNESNRPKEPQYGLHFEVLATRGRNEFGVSSNTTWELDPKRLSFVLSRYKFVGRMMENLPSVLEIGCGDGFYSRVVRQFVATLDLTDFDPIYVEEAKLQLVDEFSAHCFVHDFISESTDKKYHGIYGLDVFEHIHPMNEHTFLTNIVESLNDDGVLILGMPSIESQIYASEASQAGHVNCKSGEEFKRLMNKYFANVFVFSMNDEVVHTGFYGMAQYLFAVCCGPINKSRK